jgi:hypothetical protein
LNLPTEKTPTLLFILSRHAYLADMRFSFIILAIFCALISGWTAALAQVQDIGVMSNGAVMHHGPAAHAQHAASADIACSPEDKGCSHHPKVVHPTLCAACVAVMIDDFAFDRDAIEAGTVLPARQKPLLATSIKPRFPPPKPFVLLS